MRAEKVVVALLKAHAPLLALVSESGIHAGTIPQGQPLPALAYSHISSVEHQTLGGWEATAGVSSRVQITAAAKSYPVLKTVLDEVRRACNNKRGHIAGVQVLNVRRAGVGPDFDSPETGVHSQSIDFMILFNEPRT